MEGTATGPCIVMLILCLAFGIFRLHQCDTRSDVVRYTLEPTSNRVRLRETRRHCLLGDLESGNELETVLIMGLV